jgi:hypothetical protein
VDGLKVMKQWIFTTIAIACMFAISACTESNQADSTGADDNVRDLPASQTVGSAADSDASDGVGDNAAETPDANHSDDQSETEQAQPSTGLELADVKIASGIDEMVEASSLVFVGTVQGPDEIINTARDVNDISQPDPNLIILGQVYRVDVEQYLQGDGPDVQNVVQSEGFIHHRGEEEDVPTDQSVIEQAKEQYGETPIQSGERYLFFANPLRGFDPDEHYVVGDAGYPTRFLLGTDGVAQQESSIEWLDEQFPPRSIDDLLAEVEMLVDQLESE